MFSQFKRLAAKEAVALADLEMDLRMTYDLSGTFLEGFFSSGQGLRYRFDIQSAAAAERIIEVAQLADTGCHTVNSLRSRIPFYGSIKVNDREYLIDD